MSSAATLALAEADGGLVFQWERRAYSRWRLALMLALSLLAHALSFYVLQVAYTPTGSLLPPPAQVVLIPPAENAALAHWIDMADPSLMTQPRPLSTEQVLGAVGFHYVPSYATVLQVFKPLPTVARKESPPRTRPPGPVPAGLLPAVAAPGKLPAAANGPAAAASRTRVELSGGIANLAAGDLPPVPPPANRAAKPLERSIFLLGVPAAGGTAWVFDQASSGDTTEKGADADARDYLARLKFKPAGGNSAPVWGWATFSWGRDAYP